MGYCFSHKSLYKIGEKVLVRGLPIKENCFGGVATITKIISNGKYSVKFDSGGAIDLVASSDLKEATNADIKKQKQIDMLDSALEEKTTFVPTKENLKLLIPWAFEE